MAQDPEVNQNWFIVMENRTVYEAIMKEAAVA
jgi:hypothetical protein